MSILHPKERSETFSKKEERIYWPSEKMRSQHLQKRKHTKNLFLTLTVAFCGRCCNYCIQVNKKQIHLRSTKDILNILNVPEDIFCTTTTFQQLKERTESNRCLSEILKLLSGRGSRCWCPYSVLLERSPLGLQTLHLINVVANLS